MAGDVQLTRKGLFRRGKPQREVEIKIGNYSLSFLMGILGNWSSWYGQGNNVTYTNHYDIVRENIPKEANSTQPQYVSDYLDRYKDEIDASAIFINYNGKKFSLESTSTKEEAGGIKSLQLKGQDFIFNEPYYKINDAWIEEKIIKFREHYNLNDGLVDTLFLLNNVVLNIIAEGRELDISHNGESFLNMINTMGGYVTLQVITKNSIINKFYLVYSDDYRCLLDKTTYPFSKYIEQDNAIRYVDNLAMLVKNFNLPQNENLKAVIDQLVIKQVEYLISSSLVELSLLNPILKFVKENYGIEIPEIDPEVVSEGIKCEEVIFDERPKVDENFLLRFFRF